MKITNKAGMPEPFVRAVSYDDYDRVGDISITELIDPPQKVELQRRHDDEIEEEAAERVWMLLGSAAHEVLRRAGEGGSGNYLQEERLTMHVGGLLVSGKPDLLDAAGIISDWKVTSVWSFMFGDKREWIQQLNLYAALYRHCGFEVRGLEIYAILRDWVKTKQADERYPTVPALRRPVPLWDPGAADRFLAHRVDLHKRARFGSEWEPCTDEERWARPEAWALVKPGQKRAMAVFGPGQSRSGGRVDAVLLQEQLAAKRPPIKVRVEHRPGQSIRCELYCQAAPFCDQWKRRGMSRSKRDKRTHKRKAAKRGTLKKEQTKREKRYAKRKLDEPPLLPIQPCATCALSVSEKGVS